MDDLTRSIDRQKKHMQSAVFDQLAKKKLSVH